jgi:hypothetical protein
LPEKEPFDMNRSRCSILVACSMLCWACGSSSDGPTTGNSAAASTCGQACQDNEVGYAIDWTMWLLWNENQAGTASGSQDKTAACPLGGTAHITGTTSVASNGIDTLHLVVDLVNCESSSTTFSLAFNGQLTWDGSFGGSNGNAVTFKSSALGITGTVKRNDQPSVGETCAVSLTDTYNKNGSSTVDWLFGEICGRPVLQ